MLNRGQGWHEVHSTTEQIAELFVISIIHSSGQGILLLTPRSSMQWMPGMCHQLVMHHAQET